jgi:penicillin G amidase
MKHIRLLLPLLLLPGCLTTWRASLPDVEGEVEIDGLDGPVEIVRDRWGIPHITATTDADAIAALGWCHAQDRLWQMELNRRIGAGRLSEVFGKRTVQTDRYLRTVGFRARAEQIAAELDPGPRSLLEAYCLGVNAWLATDPKLPPEFGLLGLQPEPFTPADGLTWMKMMALSLGSDASQEYARTRLYETMDPAMADLLLASHPGDPVIMPPAGDSDGAADGGTARLDPAGGAPPGLRALLPIDVQGLGSNNWVVHGDHTTTGSPLLANDPHLQLSMPSVWYLAHLRGDRLHVAGATFPGLPLVVIGHNEHVAWGLTNVNPDVQDLVLERFDPADPLRVAFEGGFEDVVVREERIEVKGGKNVVLQVRETRHGPIMTEFYDELDSEVALRWTALQPGDRSVEAFSGVNLAASVEEAAAALEHYQGPAQNFALADDDGHIGWVAAGWVPLRPDGDDGNLPVPGWDGQHEWLDYVPFEGLPQAFDPERGWIVTANNRPVGDDFPYPLGDDWSAPYRARRIEQRLTDALPISPEGMAAIQSDTTSLLALELIGPFRTALRHDPRVAALVREWEGEMATDSVGATVFQAWLRQLTPALVADEAGERADLVRSINATVLHRCYVLGDCPFCDDVTTEDTTETCEDMAELAMDRALVMLTERLGEHPPDWTWGSLHHTVFHHQLAALPVLRRLLDRSVPRDGGPYTVNVAWSSSSAPFRNHWGPSYRQVLDPSDWDASRFMHTTGQSGHPASPHYDDLIESWLHCRSIPLAFTDQAVEEVTSRVQILMPQ